MKRVLSTCLLLTIVLAACGPINPLSRLEGPTPLPGAGETPLPLADVSFRVHPPSSTPGEAGLAVEFVDPVTGVSYNPRREAMNQAEDGTWQLLQPIPVGSLIRYRYVMTAPETSHERTNDGEVVRYRVAGVPAAIQLEDSIAAWGSAGGSGPTGRLLGEVVEAGSGLPVPEMIVTAAGRQTFSDAEGRFRLEGLVPGLHNVVAYHPDGAYQIAQQGAIVAAESTTPARFAVEPAPPVTLTFQVEVPPDTPPEQAPKLAGNVRSLGAVFAPLAGDLEVSGARLPTLVPVDETHYLALVRLHAGTDLRYKYSLGDGLWNAERDAQGALVTRQLIVPETDTTIEDSVTAWRAGSEPLTFNVEVPPATTTADEISIQFNPFTWFEPLPMSPSGETSWSYHLYGPLRMTDSLTYRYCRNLLCDGAGDGGAGAAARSVDPAAGGATSDSVTGWPWAPGAAETPEVGEIDVAPRPDLLLAGELLPRYQPGWVQFDPQAMARVADLGATAVVLSPSWVAAGDAAAPRLEFDPTEARFRAELGDAAEAAAEQGLTVILRPEIQVEDGWWQRADRDANWWAVYFEELRSFLLTQAHLAEEVGAARLVLTGSQLAPALPGGQLPSGDGSGLPADAFGRWTSLLRELQDAFSGEVAFELELHDDLMDVPGFLEEFDAVHIYWHAPLAEPGVASSVAELEAEAQRYLDLEVLPALPPDLPVIVSLEYLSLENAAAACPSGPEGGCRAAEDFDLGAEGDPGIDVDLNAQRQALEAVLRAVATESRIEGISVRRFQPLVALQDKSASVYGKPAGRMLQYWYLALRGESPP